MGPGPGPVLGPVLGPLLNPVFGLGPVSNEGDILCDIRLSS